MPFVRLRVLLVSAALAAASPGLAACGDDGDTGDTGGATAPGDAATTSPAAPGAADAPAIVISGFAFSVSAAAPGTVTVRNDDAAPHTVTADDGSFDVRVAPNATAQIEVGAGSHPFRCTIHPTMTGTLEVG